MKQSSKELELLAVTGPQKPDSPLGRPGDPGDGWGFWWYRGYDLGLRLETSFAADLTSTGGPRKNFWHLPNIDKIPSGKRVQNYGNSQFFG